VAQMTARIQALEERNAALAKMLENAMEALWIQQREFAKEKADGAADALSLAITKVQFVQVYLEDTTLPLPPKNPAPEAIDTAEGTPALDVPTPQFKSPAPEQEATSPSPSGKPESKEPAVPETATIPESSQPAIPMRASDKALGQHGRSHPTPPVQDPPQISISEERPGPSLFHHPRPSLAQSSFSWMLGEDQQKSSFVSASPFPRESRRESTMRVKGGFLFGEEKGDGKGPSALRGDEKVNDDDNSEEVFKLGTLKGL